MMNFFDETVDFNYLFKLTTVGRQNTGKSSILSRFMYNEFNIDMESTIGVEFKSKNLTIDKSVIKLQIWDTAGQERFRALSPHYYRGARAVLAVYDIANLTSFKEIDFWLDEAIEHLGSDVNVVLIGNKCDLDKMRQVPTSIAASYAKIKSTQFKNPILFYETSASKDINIGNIFNAIAVRLLKEENFKEINMITNIISEPIESNCLKCQNHININENNTHESKKCNC
jgi:small GTP-binding protein